MGVLDFFRSPKPVTAAVSIQRVDQTRQMDRPMTETREASEAWTVWRCVGEIHYSTTQQSRLVGRLDWTLTSDGGEPMDTASSEAVLAAAFGSMKNVRALAETAATHLQVPGGFQLARTVPNDNNSWRIISLGPTQKQKKLLERADHVFVVRNEDPKDPDRSDSPVLASLDTSRELILARAQARAQARNRTAQHGLLVYALEANVNEQQLMDVMTAPLADERSAASVVPNLLGVNKDFVDSFNHIDLGGDYDEKLSDRIEKLVRSLAVQLDVPPELLLGFGDTNHWSAWAIQEDNWLGHVEPLASPVGDVFAQAIMALTDSTGIELEPDPGPLLQRRPTAADALAAYGADLVTADWAREQLGANQTDAPELAPQDPAIAIVVDMVTSAPTLAREITIPVLVEQVRAILNGTVAPANPVAVPDAPASAEPAVAAAAPVRALAAAASSIDGRALYAIDQQAYDAMQDLIADTTDRTLEVLGGKVRRMAQAQKIDVPDVGNIELATRSGGQIPNSEPLIDAAVGDALPRVERIVDRAFTRLRAAGVDLSVDTDDLGQVWSLFTALVTDIVTTRLTGQPADALTWQASRRIVSVAGGNGDSGPIAAAAGVQVTGLGIALGQRAIAQITQVYNLVPGSYTWLHNYSGKAPHPEHKKFAGRSFNGDYVLEDGINWFPGDHAGCQCAGIPEFVEAS